MATPLAAEPSFACVKRTPVVGIMGITEETETIETLIENPKTEVYGTFRFISGTVLNKKVVLAQIGYGKANSASAAALLIDKFDVDCVIFSGTAGALNPDYIQGDVVVGSDLVQHDLGQVSQEGFISWQPTLATDGSDLPKWLSPPESLLAVAREAGHAVKLTQTDLTAGVRPPRVWEGVIATGDSFISEPSKSAEIRKRFKADAVEMEGAAVAQVCYQAGVPCLVIRSLTDRADGSAFMAYQKFVKIAGRNAAALVWEILNRLDKADLPSKKAPQTRQLWYLISGLNFCAGSSYSAKYPQYPDLFDMQKSDIAARTHKKIVDIALHLVPARRVGMTFQAGANGVGPVNLSSEVVIKATREEARAVAAIIGYLGQKSMVMGITETGPFPRHALLIESTATNGWNNIEQLRTQWPQLAGINPYLCPGFTRLPASRADCLLVIDVQGLWPYTTWYDAPEQIQKAAASLQMPVRITRVAPAFLQVRNNWADHSNGEDYLAILKRILNEQKMESLKKAVMEVDQTTEKAFQEIQNRSKK